MGKTGRSQFRVLIFHVEGDREIGRALLLQFALPPVLVVGQKHVIRNYFLCYTKYLFGRTFPPTDDDGGGNRTQPRTVEHHRNETTTKALSQPSFIFFGSPVNARWTNTRINNKSLTVYDFVSIMASFKDQVSWHIVDVSGSLGAVTVTKKIRRILVEKPIRAVL